jgi:hypothetical protein
MRVCTNPFIIVLTTLLFVGSASAQATTQPGALSQELGEMNFSDIALADVMEFLRDVSRQNIFVNWRALEKEGINRSTPVTLRSKAVTLEQMLTSLAEALGKKDALSFAERDGVIYISSADDLKKHASVTPLPPRGDEQAASKTLDAMKRPLPELNMVSIPVADAVEFIKDVTKLKIDVNWEALAAENIGKSTPVSLRVRNLPVSAALRILLDDIGGGGDGAALNYVVDGERVLISSEKDLAKK